MKFLLVPAILAFLVAGSIAAQNPSSTGVRNVPVSSPEPMTMLALAGGVGAALGLSKRRNKNKK
jgi:hypothetical protein